MSRFVATPFVESNTQTVKVKQVQDQLKHIETRALDQTQDQQGLISKEISQPSPSGHPPATASGLSFYFHFSKATLSVNCTSQNPYIQLITNHLN